MRRLAILLPTLLALAHAPALAQPAADPGQTAYDEGRRLYEQHRWDAAIAQFKESYRLRHDAPSLFNIAQAYRLTGDCARAVEFYRQYKQEFPTAPNIAKVDKFIVDLEACAKEHAPVEPQPPTPPPPQPPPPAVVQPTVAPTPASDVDHGQRRRVTAFAVGGAGVLAVVTGFYFGHLASADADQVKHGSGTWDPSVESAGKRDDLIAKVLWGVGGAAIVGGTVLYLLGERGEAPHVAIVPASGGGSVVWACGF
jgi:tetratricopeptide (TPR) repeat protein